jgi:hypothetical protein
MTFSMEEYRDKFDADFGQYIRTTYADNPFPKWGAIHSYVDTQTTVNGPGRWRLELDAMYSFSRITREVVNGRNAYLPVYWGRGTQYQTPEGMDADMALAKGKAFEAAAAGLSRYGFQYLTLAAEKGAEMDLTTIAEARDLLNEVIAAFQP